MTVQDYSEVTRVRDVPDLVEQLRETASEDMSDEEMVLNSAHGLMAVVQACQRDLAEERLRGVAFVALREDGSAAVVLAGEVFRPARILYRAVQGAL